MPPTELLMVGSNQRPLFCILLEAASIEAASFFLIRKLADEPEVSVAKIEDAERSLRLN